MQIYDENATVVGEIDYNKEKFSNVRVVTLKTVINMYEANKRQGNASTKTRSEVRGGGRKPWAQKHLGRARAGSTVSPIMRGGGITFGPKPRDYSYRIPKKVKRAALNSALTSKFVDNEIVVVDQLNFDKPSTKKMAQLLNVLNIENSCLIVTNEPSVLVYKSARNLRSVIVRPVSDLNAYDVIKQRVLLITKSAMDTLNLN